MNISLSRILGGLICIGIGCFFLAGSWGIYVEHNRIKAYSGLTSGRITKKHFQTAADGSGNYYLDYWFMTSRGDKINVTSGMSKQQWDTLKVDDAIEVRYDLLNPGRNIPLYGGNPSLVAAFLIMVLGSVLLIFGVLGFFRGFKK